MKSSAFVLILSLLANLSFAKLSVDTLTVQTNNSYMDTASRESLKVTLVGDWTKISQDELGWGFSSLSLFADGKFKGTSTDGLDVSGSWEISSDGQIIAIHKLSKKTGEKLETVLAQIETVDGHTLTLRSFGVKEAKQTFIQ